MKTRLIWEFEVDVKDIDPRFVDVDGLAEDLTKREMHHMIENRLLTIDDFIYEKEDVQPTEENPKHAVVITFSYDPQVSVLLFNDEKSAMEFIRKDAEEELAIDEEYGRTSSLVINQDEGRAVLKTGYSNGVETTEWRIGTIFEREET